MVLKCEELYLGRIATAEFHQSTSVASTSSIEGIRISLTGARHGIAQKKVKLKTLKGTSFSKTMAARIILKLKKFGAKIL